MTEYRRTVLSQTMAEHHPLNAHSPGGLIRLRSKNGHKRDTTDKHLNGKETMSSKTKLSDEAQHLALVPLFRQLDEHDLAKLAEEVDQVFFKSGEAIFHEYDQGNALYLVESGAVRIWVHDDDVQEVTLSELKPGDFFGELSVLDKGERSANATAMTDSTLHRLRRDDFHQFMLKHPHVAIDLICEIGARLRQTNMLVSRRVTRNVNAEMERKLTVGQRIADKVASFGGSWTFIITYGAILIVWMAVNTFFLARYSSGQNGAQFDPYPYILLNLMLSMTAAMQAPVILMSQNRATERDRFAAEQDFKVNLKSELMLDSLTRNDRERNVQMEQLMGAIALIQGRPIGEDRAHLDAVVAD
jgi:CRP/FNR family transcriptional regulator, cyclic AMP receptor protein